MARAKSAPPPDDDVLPPSDDVLVPTQAAAERLGIAAGTLRNWRMNGQGPAYVRLQRDIRYSRNELDRWIAARTTRPGVTPDLLAAAAAAAADAPPLSDEQASRLRALLAAHEAVGERTRLPGHSVTEEAMPTA